MGEAQVHVQLEYLTDDPTQEQSASFFAESLSFDATYLAGTIDTQAQAELVLGVYENQVEDKIYYGLYRLATWHKFGFDLDEGAQVQKDKVFLRFLYPTDRPDVTAGYCHQINYNKKPVPTIDLGEHKSQWKWLVRRQTDGTNPADVHYYLIDIETKNPGDIEADPCAPLKHKLSKLKQDQPDNLMAQFVTRQALANCQAAHDSNP